MVIDSSVIVAIVMAEPGCERLLEQIRESAPVGIAAPAVVETALVLSHRLRGDPGPLLFELLDELEVEVIPFSFEHAKSAIAAFLRYGKGRHPAALNFGDCIVYASAAVLGEPLLFTGEDFGHTELARG